MAPNLELQKWIAPYSLNQLWNYFWGSIIFCHLFRIWFTKIITIITKQNKNPSWLLSDKVSFLLPSPPLSLDGDHSPSVPSAIGTQANFPAGASGSLAGSGGSGVGSFPRAWPVLGLGTRCWDSVPLSSRVQWGHGTARAAPVLTQSLPCCPQSSKSQQTPAHSSRDLGVF